VSPATGNTGPALVSAAGDNTGPAPIAGGESIVNGNGASRNTARNAIGPASDWQASQTDLEIQESRLTVVHNNRPGPPAGNTTTKAELLSRAKAAIEAGEQSLQEAAEALGLAQEDHSATQREMAEAVGKSASWVNKLLKWRRSGYKDHSPFGPTTKKGRVEHAQQRAKVSKPRKADLQARPAADAAEAAATSAAELANFIVAVDSVFVKLSWDDQCKAFAYLKKKMKPPEQQGGAI